MIGGRRQGALGDRRFRRLFIGQAASAAGTALVPVALALLGVARSSTAIGGQVAAGVLVAAFGAASVFAIDAATYLVSAASLVLIRPQGAAATNAVSSVRRDLVEGWRAFRSQTWIAAGSIHIALLNAFVLAPFFVLGPVVSARWLGGAAAWGAVAAGFALGMVLGGMLAMRVRAERPLVPAFAAILLSIPQFVLLAAHAPVALVVVAAVLCGGQSSFFTALWTTTLQARVPPAAISRVAALSSVSMLALAPVAYALVGPATEIAGVSEVLLFGAGWTLISTGVVLSLGSVRGLTWPVRAEAGALSTDVLAFAGAGGEDRAVGPDADQ